MTEKQSLDDLTPTSPLLLNGDCLELMKTLPDKSVDLFICDLPYGETNCSWDTAIDLAEFWRQFKRIRKNKRTACIHFCSTGFGYTLIKSWEKGYKMDMVWKKRNKTGGLQSRYRPMRNHEMVYFFYEQAPKYNRDRWHKRINSVPMSGSDHHPNLSRQAVNPKRGQPNFEPKQPASVLEAEATLYGATKADPGWWAHNSFKGNENPASVIEEKYTEHHKTHHKSAHGGSDTHSIFTKENIKAWNKANPPFVPPTPASVLEEAAPARKSKKDRTGMVGGGSYRRGLYSRAIQNLSGRAQGAGAHNIF